MICSNEFFIFNSPTEDMSHQWSWDLAVEFSSVEWQLLQSPNGAFMVFLLLSLFTIPLMI